MSKKIFRYFCLAFAVAIMIFLFDMSSKTGEKSGGISAKIIKFLADTFVDEFKNGTDEFRQLYIESMQHFVRKAAHFSIYASLGFFVCGFNSTFFAKGLKIWVISVIFSAVYACTDEIHQLFVLERSGSFSDVLLDTAGAAVGAALMIFIVFLFRRRKNENRRKQKQRQ